MDDLIDARFEHRPFVLRQRRHLVLETAPGRRRQCAGHMRLHARVVRAVHQHSRCAILQVALLAAAALGHLLRVEGQAEAARVAISQVEHGQSRAIRRLPVKAPAGDRIGYPAPEAGARQSELLHDLRHLGDVSELIRAMAHAQGPAQLVGKADPLLEAADVRFAARQELVWLHPPGPDDDPPAFDQRLQTGFVFWTQFEVVVDHDRLAIEVEVLVLRVLLHVIQQFVDHLDQAPAEEFVRLIPLAVPVAVRHDVHGAGHRQAGARGARPFVATAVERKTSHIRVLVSYAPRNGRRAPG